MFHRLRQFIGMRIAASDGEIGKITDIYFDDRSWAVRYLVIETGSWFAERKVLISPLSVTRIDWDHQTVAIDLTRRRVEASPPIDTDKPVSRQHEAEFCDYYGYPYYWSGGESPLDLKLRSSVEVTAYGLRATDSTIGHLEDFMLDAQTWAIRYLVVDTPHRSDRIQVRPSLGRRTHRGPQHVRPPISSPNSAGPVSHTRRRTGWQPNDRSTEC